MVRGLNINPVVIAAMVPVCLVFAAFAYTASPNPDLGEIVTPDTGQMQEMRQPEKKEPAQEGMEPDNPEPCATPTAAGVPGLNDTTVKP